MTEAGWTRNAPTKEGWYWWQRTENDNPVVVWVNAFHPDQQLRAEMISGRRELLAHFNGLFKGPITPTDWQQGRVAGLREAEEYALRCLKELQDKIRDLESGKCVLAGAQTKKGVEAWVHAKTLEASRIAKWITARIIEQQAQEGK